jgi:hypothetical protein
MENGGRTSNLSPSFQYRTLYPFPLSTRKIAFLISVPRNNIQVFFHHIAESKSGKQKSSSAGAQVIAKMFGSDLENVRVTFSIPREADDLHVILFGYNPNISTPQQTEGELDFLCKVPLGPLFGIETFPKNRIKSDQLVVMIIECPGRAKALVVRPSAVHSGFAHTMPIKLLALWSVLKEDYDRFDELGVFSVASVAKLLFRNVSLTRKQRNPCSVPEVSFLDVCKL